VLAGLENSEFSALMRTELWGWPLALTLHEFGTALVMGFIFIICLRLLGIFETIPYTSLQRLFPVIWAALALQFLTGVALWMTKPTRFTADTAFLLKLLFIIIGVVLTSYLYGFVKREAGSWEQGGAVSSPAIKFVAPSLLVWCVVLIAGRLTAYLGSLFNG
jgi:hypothetical protein